MDVPESLRYTKDHEWLRTEGGEAVVGITAYAAEELGDASLGVGLILTFCIYTIGH